ncbi:MAG: GGDEF domain-containing protein, partial [Pseudomonadota bacterium]
MADRRQQSGPKSDVVAMRDALDQSLGELDLVYGIEPRLKDEKTGRARLTLLLRMLTRFLDMSYAVLMVPTRNVRIAVTHKNWQNVDRQLIDERLLRDVLPKFAQETTPRLLQLAEVPHGAEGPGGRYQMLLQPVRAADGQAIGMMALMCQTQGRPLSIVAKRLLTHFTHVAQRVIEASFDPLTGFMRRDDFDALVAEGVVLASQREEPWALLYFDVDRLQVANDTFNQSAGDEVLQRFARLLEDETPQGTPLARLGGDKFSVLLRGFDIVHAVELAERIRGACTALEVARNGHVFPVTVSGGIVSLNDRRAREKGPLVVAKM